jgi:hypothetical protein
MAVMPFTWSDLVSFQELTRMRLESWEVEAFEVLDEILLKELALQDKAAFERARQAAQGGKK